MQTKHRLRLLFLTLLVAAVFATGSAQSQTYTYSVLYSFQGLAGRRISPRRFSAGRAGQPVWHYVWRRRYRCMGQCSKWIRLAGRPCCTASPRRTASTRSRSSAGRAGQSVWHYRYGGASGSGTVFKVDTTGKETVLYSFTEGGRRNSRRRFSAGRAGQPVWHDRYGGAYGCGTVFKVDTTGNETVLYSFTHWGGRQIALRRFSAGRAGQPVWHYPHRRRPCILYGCGTVFKVDTTGKETVLYSFTGKQALGDGANPFADLVRDAQGNLYGTTSSRGAYLYGTVFKVDTTGKETVLYSFIGTEGDGANPVARLVQDTQGNLYGTTYGGGAHQHGTVFKLDTTGKETVLYSFTGGADGGSPESGLVLDAQGNLYGTTSGGGDLACDAPYGCGTVFELQMPSTLTVSTIGNGTVTSIDGFISCPGTCSHTYSSGAQVTLNAAAGRGKRATPGSAGPVTVGWTDVPSSGGEIAALEILPQPTEYAVTGTFSGWGTRQAGCSGVNVLTGVTEAGGQTAGTYL